MARARPIAWMFRGLIALIAIIVVAAVIIAGRLSQGPISLEYFKPRLETALAESLGGKDSTIDRLTLDARDGRIALSAYGVATHGEIGHTLARAKQINLRLAPKALMRGQIEPTRLDVVGARLVVIRDASGPLQLLAMTDDAEPGNQDAPDIFALVREWVSGGVNNVSLPDIKLEKASFRALDRESGEILWEGQADAGFTLQGTRASLWAVIGFDPTRDAPPLKLLGTLVQHEGGHATATLTNAKLAALARVARLFGAELPPLEGSVEGGAYIKINSGLLPTNARAALSMAEIEIALPDGKQVTLDRAAIEAELNIPTGQLKITGMRLGEQGTGLVGAATLASTGSVEGKSSYTLAGRIDHANLNYLAKLAGAGDIAAGVDLALSADFDLALLNGKLATFESQVRANGEINPLDLFQTPLRLNDLQALVSFNASENKVAVQGLTSNLNGIEISAEGAAALGSSEEIETLALKARLGAFPVETLAQVWPSKISPGGRRWVARNLSKGRITGGDLNISKRKGKPFDVASDFAATGMSVRYWDPMPSGTDIIGRGKIRGDTLTLNVSRGSSGGLKTNDVKVVFTKLGAPKEYIEIDGAIQGPVAKLLALLDRPPLKYAEWLGVRPI
ncbi:MAG: YhdP family protein, partial [Alphaproteobacteria bacterium]